ncbi:hypothetical protein Fmac_015785 [Flemingia macrophylla]|uniref:Uncharacterized protein n=1 Tax=Flemingia macrophylla TaxID=520843 RepID=A0ABD1MFJ5_9FABA
MTCEEEEEREWKSRKCKGGLLFEHLALKLAPRAEITRFRCLTPILNYNTKLFNFGLARDGLMGDATHVSTQVLMKLCD